MYRPDPKAITGETIFQILKAIFGSIAFEEEETGVLRLLVKEIFPFLTPKILPEIRETLIEVLMWAPKPGEMPPIHWTDQICCCTPQLLERRWRENEARLQKVTDIKTPEALIELLRITGEALRMISKVEHDATSTLLSQTRRDSFKYLQYTININDCRWYAGLVDRLWPLLVLPETKEWTPALTGELLSHIRSR